MLALELLALALAAPSALLAVRDLLAYHALTRAQLLEQRTIAFDVTVQLHCAVSDRDDRCPQTIAISARLTAQEPPV